MKITVLIPVYNTRPEHLLEAVYSILNQSCGIGAFEKIIIYDDASENLETIQAYDLLVNKDLIEIQSWPFNRGTSVALNESHSLVKTEYVALMGSDDISHPDRFKLQIDYLKKHPDTDVLGTNLFSYYDHDIKRTPIFTSTHKEIPTGLAGDKRWLVNHGTVIYRQSAVMAVGGYNEKLRRAQDVDLWERMKNNGAVFRNITQVLYAWRRFKK